MLPFFEETLIKFVPDDGILKLKIMYGIKCLLQELFLFSRKECREQASNMNGSLANIENIRYNTNGEIEGDTLTLEALMIDPQVPPSFHLARLNVKISFAKYFVAFTRFRANFLAPIWNFCTRLLNIKNLIKIFILKIDLKNHCLRSKLWSF
jgi:hypothetical protein